MRAQERSTFTAAQLTNEIDKPAANSNRPVHALRKHIRKEALPGTPLVVSPATAATTAAAAAAAAAATTTTAATTAATAAVTPYPIWVALRKLAGRQPGNQRLHGRTCHAARIASLAAAASRRQRARARACTSASVPESSYALQRP
ncbi:MAG: hypothetical protein ACK4FW_13145, partial [Stenotrophomonas sp.]